MQPRYIGKFFLQPCYRGVLLGDGRSASARLRHALCIHAQYLYAPTFTKPAGHGLSLALMTATFATVSAPQMELARLA